MHPNNWGVTLHERESCMLEKNWALYCQLKKTDLKEWIGNVNLAHGASLQETLEKNENGKKTLYENQKSFIYKPRTFLTMSEWKI